MNTRKNLICTLLFLLIFVVGCDIPSSNQPIQQSSNDILFYPHPSSSTSQSANVEDYLICPDNSRYLKYFNENWNVVHYISKASFYKSVYYRKCVIDPDSLAVDFLFAESPDKCNGKMLIFYKNGQLESESYYKNGVPDGKCTGYYDNGKIRYVLHYKDGLKEGEHVFYYYNGEVNSVVPYKNDKPHGMYHFFYENGALKEVGSFEHGISTGAYKSYFEDGKIQIKGNYKNGKESGIWYFYDEYGHYTTKDYGHPVIVQQSQSNNHRSSLTPDDAYNEGYDNGYSQGYQDGRRGRGFGYDYDDDELSSYYYYDYYEDKYEEGYEEGYIDGYEDGQSEYEEGDEDDWW